MDSKGGRGSPGGEGWVSQAEKVLLGRGQVTSRRKVRASGLRGNDLSGKVGTERRVVLGHSGLTGGGYSVRRWPSRAEELLPGQGREGAVLRRGGGAVEAGQEVCLWEGEDYCRAKRQCCKK